MKVFLDDERTTPEGWVRVYWPGESIALLQTGQVTDISLDHDLGDDARGTGYDGALGGRVGAVAWLYATAHDGAFRQCRRTAAHARRHSAD